MAEVVHFKPIKARSRRRRVEAAGREANSRLPELRSSSKVQTNANVIGSDPETTPSVMALLKTVVVPIVILLCSIAAFAIFVAHVSGQPGYSARNNVSSPSLVE
ncbi:hypothetical protein HGP16_21290 [Rhizobium sp. P40RR-XXII]|uniref:hypothetical protein n=1 Tax=Rhizobium sp. P40RR-XXII TaxID=2726739 RepID=UPI001456C4CF|nr:hypothetical protein [Rhizobium sp. P40RR-XXII]NLS19076.1 hypothetical protein [Rhizobium sp. P40RR-XXII]